MMATTPPTPNAAALKTPPNDPLLAELARRGVAVENVDHDAEILAELRHRRRVMADPNAAAEALLWDTRTTPPVRVRQSWLQRLWWEFLQKARARGLNAGILSPWGVGKTEQFAKLLPVAELGARPMARVALITASDDMAAARVRAVRSLIEMGEPARYWPHLRAVRPGDTSQWGHSYRLQGTWTDHKLEFDRPVPEVKDPSVTGAGLNTTNIGSRFSMLIFDDPVDSDEIRSEATRERNRIAFVNTWINRLDPDGMAVCIMTPWAPGDLWHTQIEGSAQWATLKTPYLPTMDGMEVIEHWPGEEPTRRTMPLPNGETVEDVKRKRAQWGESGWQRGGLLQPRSEYERTMPHFGESVYDWSGHDPNTTTADEVRRILVRPEWRFFAGCDLSSLKRAGTAVGIIGVDPKGAPKVPRDGAVGKWTDDELYERLEAFHGLYRCAQYRVENNAVQDRVVQGLQARARGRGESAPMLNIVPHFTGKGKWDDVTGLPGLDTEFANGHWVWVFDPDEDGTRDTFWSRVYREFQDHPNAGTSDILMAFWMASSAALDYLSAPSVATPMTPAQVRRLLAEDDDSDDA